MTTFRKWVGRLVAARSQGARGMTLIEIMVVVAILGLIAGVVAVGMQGAWGGAQVDKARLDIHGFEQGLDIYKLKKGRYPSSSEGLQVLYSEGILKGQLAKDPWGKEYLYLFPGQKNQKGFDIVSYGPDGNQGGGDDISNGDQE
jgi:general secretion pathway protein G